MKAPRSHSQRIFIGVVIAAIVSVIVLGLISVPHYRSSISGRLLMTGGPPPGTSRPSVGEVTATNGKGQNYSAQVPVSGKFTLHLPAGTYKLTGTSPQYGGGKYTCAALHAVTVHADESAQVNVLCEMF